MSEEDHSKAECATRLQRLLRTQLVLLRSIRAVRALVEQLLPWRAQARLLLASCAALAPPPSSVAEAAAPDYPNAPAEGASELEEGVAGGVAAVVRVGKEGLGRYAAHVPSGRC